MTAETAQETLLLVDDEENTRTFVSTILRDRGYRVLEAGDGNEALRCAQTVQSRIDLVLTDVMMPGMHGWALADEVAKIHPEAKILLMSGYPDDEVLRRTLSGRPMALLLKPFTSSELLRKVREVLDQ